MGGGAMETREVFSLGLGLSAPWKLSGQRLDIEKRPHELHLEVVADRERGVSLPGVPARLQGARLRELYLAAPELLPASLLHHRTGAAGRLPGSRGQAGGGPVGAAGQPSSRCCSMHAALVLVREMPVLGGGALHRHHRQAAVADRRSLCPPGRSAGLDLRGVRSLGLDETASRRRHNYVTVFIDMDRRDKPVIFVTPGKGKACVAEVPGLHAGPWRRTDRGRRGRVRHVAGVPGGGGRELPKRRPHRRLVPCRPAVHNRRRPSAQGRVPVSATSPRPPAGPCSRPAIALSPTTPASRPRRARKTMDRASPPPRPTAPRKCCAGSATPRHRKPPDGASPDSSTISVSASIPPRCSIPSERRSAPSPRTSIASSSAGHLPMSNASARRLERHLPGRPVTRARLSRYRHLRHHHLPARGPAARHLQIHLKRHEVTKDYYLPGDLENQISAFVDHWQQPTLPREHRQRNSSRRLLWTPHRHHRKEKKDQKTDHPKPPLEPSTPSGLTSNNDEPDHPL